MFRFQSCGGFDVRFLKGRGGSGKPSEPGRGKVEEPRFVENVQDGARTYEYYKQADPEAAKAWLLTKKVEKPLYYIQVRTDRGTWGMDKDGLYLTSLLPWQTELSRAGAKGRIVGTVNMLGLAMAAKGIVDNFVIEVRCGKSDCESVWLDALRYQNKTIVRCPKCATYNEIDSGNIRYIEGVGAQISLGGF
jgi:hypothetical protein